MNRYQRSEIPSNHILQLKVNDKKGCTNISFHSQLELGLRITKITDSVECSYLLKDGP